MKTDLFACRTVYRHQFKEDTRTRRTFEERIVLIRAKNFKDAVIRAEKEAKQYCRQLKTCTYLGHVDAFAVYELPLKHGSEVYSLMRDSALSDDAYIRRFFETGKEHSGKVPVL